MARGTADRVNTMTGAIMRLTPHQFAQAAVDGLVYPVEDSGESEEKESGY